MIQSDLFTFIIGKERTPFVVHSNVIAATSDTFRALIRGGLSESKARCAELIDVEPDDFVRFLEYAYRRDYTVPPWVLDDSNGTNSRREGNCARDITYTQVPRSTPIVGVEASASFQVLDSANEDEGEEDEEEPAGPVIRADNPWESFSTQLSRQKAVKKNKKKERKRDTKSLRVRFQNHKYLLAGAPPIEDVLEQCRPKANSAPDQDFTPVFLGHARLYTFAEMRLVEPLKSLALYKLHATLLDFCLYERRVGDVVELARYAYDTGPDRSETGKLNELRQLVVEYMACEMDTIGKHPAFQVLLEEGGEFVTDFWRIMSKWLLVT